MRAPTPPGEVVHDALTGGEGHDHCVERIERYRSALDGVGEAVVIVDDRGEELYRNGPARTLLSAPIAGALASSAITEQLVAARAGEATERTLELFVPLRRVLRIRAFGLGTATGAAAIVEDVSDRRRVDDIRRDFVANVSHELKTPVGALSLLAETLDGEEDPEVVTRLVDRITAEAERLARLIDDLLDLSRIEAHETPQIEVVDVVALVAEAVAAVDSQAAAAGVAIEVTGVDATLQVAGNRWELSSALKNLIDNAVKYTERGGWVRVSAGARDDCVELAVCDNGIGIPAHDRERIFERFYRVDRARSRLTGGTGLGLSIVRHVAANHSGSVEVVSEEGAGSTFTLRLPLAEVEEQANG